MAILEGSAVADTNKSFCESCYVLEGDVPLVFTAAEVLQRIERSLDKEFDSTNSRVNINIV